MGYVFARLIYKGKWALEDVPEKYYDATIAAYLDLYNIDLSATAEATTSDSTEDTTEDSAEDSTEE